MARLKKKATKKKPAAKRAKERVRLGEYEALAGKVDDFFNRVHDRYRADMRCGAGCSDCCGHHLTVSLVEAESIARTLATRDAGTRARLATRAAGLPEGEGPCPALEEDGRCAVYEGRPLVCRSHGAPMYVGSASLPVLADVLKEAEGEGEGAVIKCCHLNFSERPLDEVDPECVLDLVNMAATLAVVNARATDDGQKAALRRILIGDVLRAAHSS